MIFIALTLENVGPFSEAQTIEFAPPSQEAPITLIGGLNGAGKTTIMRSIFHSLFGPHALALMDYPRGYERYLREAAHRGTSTSKLELTLRIATDGGFDSIRIRRIWRERAGKHAESVSVFRNGIFDEALTSGWSSYVESIAPRAVARLFFFDGEKVEALADLESSRETIETALGGLLGLDLVDQLVTDLAVVERRQADAASNREDRGQLRALERELEQSRAFVESARKGVEETVDQLERAEIELAEAEAMYQGAGGDHFERQESIAVRLREATRDRDARLSSLRYLAADDAAPLMLVTTQLDEGVRQVMTDTEAEMGQVVSQTLEQFEAGIDAGSAGAADDREESTSNRWSELRERLVKSAVLELSSALASHSTLTNAAKVRIPSLKDAIAEEHAHWLRDENEMVMAEGESERTPPEDALAPFVSRRNAARSRSSQLRSTKDSALADIEFRQRELDRLEASRDREVKRIAESSIESLSARRILEHSARSRELLTTFRATAARRHLTRLSALTEDALDQLLRKERLISSVQIAESDYSIDFFDGEGEKIDTTRFSAGERQLTALALLWALARASGRSLPIVVDTPLGRLDSSHREQVVTRYMPSASHQVIVLSTDTEVIGDLKTKVDEHVGKAYRLEFDDSTNATEICEGYFADEVVSGAHA